MPRNRIARKGLAALLALLATAGQAQAKDDVPYSYYLVSCGSYLQHRALPSDSSLTADTYYIAGWISAYNRLRVDESIPDDTTLDDVMLWLDGYCVEHRLSNLETGLMQLAQDVKPRNQALSDAPLAEAASKPKAKPAPKPKPAAEPRLQNELKPLVF